MLHAPNITISRRNHLDMPSLLEVLAHNSARPRYAFMILNLIAKVASANGSAGALVVRDGGLVPLRDWLCKALMPMGHRDPRRIALGLRIRAELEQMGSLPANAEEAYKAVEAEVRERLRASGKANVSRAVSELVKSGLLRRHYHGYRVDHHNRGGQRQAVYTLLSSVQVLLGAGNGPSGSVPKMHQSELPF
jgi:hypothetical protein